MMSRKLLKITKLFIKGNASAEMRHAESRTYVEMEEATVFGTLWKPEAT